MRWQWVPGHSGDRGNERASGEDAILYCEEFGYAANVETATSIPPDAPPCADPRPLQKHATPDIRTVEQLVEFFDLPAGAMAKTLLYEAVFEGAPEAKVVAVLMRGDLGVNEVKLVNALGCLAVALAGEDTVRRVTGADVGFAGPLGLPAELRVLADLTLKGRTNLLCGCNETDFHCRDVNFGRDCPEPEFHDLRLARAGEREPDGGGVLKQARGIEVGHIFKLGTKYSSAMGATFTGEDGKPTPFVMGCYGIGVTRTAQAAVEQGHDDKGIIWPAPIAPFEVAIAILDVRNEDQIGVAEGLYRELRAAGVDACLDDRKLRPGPKFKDLDLLGFPLQVIVGRNAAAGRVEFVVRATGAKDDVEVDHVLPRCREFLGR